MTHGSAKVRRRRFKALAMFAMTMAGLAVGLSACAPSATYPPVETTARLARPTFEPVPTVIATAIRYARENLAPGSDLAINLPAGVGADAYDKVIAKLEGGGRPMTVEGEPAIHITEVRTRHFNAQVDLIYPRPDGLNQFVTLTLKRSVLENYRVMRTRPWQMRDVMARMPNYVAPPPEAAPPEEEPAAEEPSADAAKLFAEDAYGAIVAQK